VKIFRDGQQIEQVSQFKYLRSIISDDGYRDKEIKSRIVMAKIVFQGKMNLELKKRIVKCLVWSVATYAAETRTLTEMDKRRTEAFEIWIRRQMIRLQIHISKASVLLSEWRGSVTWIK